MMTDFLIIILLIMISIFLSVAELSLAAARKMKLQKFIEEGDARAQLVVKLQKNPGGFFTVIQIGTNAVTILAGVLGDNLFSSLFGPLLTYFFSPTVAQTLSFICSFLLVTSLFILLADLIPKRICMIYPEQCALKTVRVMSGLIFICKPLVWFFNGLANGFLRLFKLPLDRKEELTSDDIYAVFELGASEGLLPKQEHELIENVFELDTRTVASAMTARDSLIFFDKNDSEQVLKEKIERYPHQRFLVCDRSIDHVIGYINAKDLLSQMLTNRGIKLNSDSNIIPALMIPDTLTLSEALETFKQNGADFAVILNEYALVVGIITLKDVMITLMGDLVNTDEEQIVQRDENSWLIEGVTPIPDVMRVLNILAFPDNATYETIAGFMMYELRKVPKRTDFVIYAGYKFEVVDIDNHKIDQLLVSKVCSPSPA